MAAFASKVVPSIAIVLPFRSPSASTTLNTQANTTLCVESQYSRLVREIVE